ncbi:zinc-binding alcohol dehydrogenase family protein [Flavilitoribacter nigricans]|uniref:Alcohol dehydrogenase n=1 Tax=Flavilitoribacter nigricans (strain ATCC 23147 / DSM 23189 / NBRC 102662 / NCIMB 1420 / SS-2) TaxID=1122177 RepID=A0A2D0NCY8_FLAN2|nr:zinc-binding alcohol dehydrogenase family protein [Flavilitoribacter nigricans]PHN06236.1 alcohol dehydrogenase [Flavilitoribacter nigricans DSM 23189 = NBRC 102662]
MKYIVCEQPGQFRLGEKEPPVAREGEVLVDIKRIGICGTDLHAFKGNQPFFTYPRILGHELSGVVNTVNSISATVKEGDRVVVVPYVNCGECLPCRNNKPNCCAKLKVLGVHTDGGMQEQISVPAELLIPVNDLSLDEAAIIEPLAIGAHALFRAKILDKETIVVIGCGPIGLGIMKLAQVLGNKVIAIDVNADRLAYARESIGIEYTINALEDPLEQVKDLTNGDLATAVFDATGNKTAMESGVQYLAHGGQYILVGLFKGDLQFNHPFIHAREASILCSRNATFTDFHQVIDVLYEKNFPVDSYITHRAPFDRMIDHFNGWLEPENGVIKAMVTLGD